MYRNLREGLRREVVRVIEPFQGSRGSTSENVTLLVQSGFHRTKFNLEGKTNPGEVDCQSFCGINRRNLSPGFGYLVD